MTYLSRLILNSRHSSVVKDITSCELLHKRILSAFPAVKEGKGKARETFGILHRLEWNRRAGVPVVIVQSTEKPDWTRIPQEYFYDAGTTIVNPAVTRLDTFLQRITNGSKWHFRLRANPVKKLAETKDNSRKVKQLEERIAAAKDRGAAALVEALQEHVTTLKTTKDPLAGKRVGLFTEAEQVNWLVRKAKDSGFKIVSLHTAPDVFDVLVQPAGTDTGKRLAFNAILFEGHLEVTDRELFLKAFHQGIGPAKGFGFGLLSIAPVQ